MRLSKHTRGLTGSFRLSKSFENRIDIASGGGISKLTWRHAGHSPKRAREVGLIAEAKLGSDRPDRIVA